MNTKKYINDRQNALLVIQQTVWYPCNHNPTFRRRWRTKTKYYHFDWCDESNAAFVDLTKEPEVFDFCLYSHSLSSDFNLMPYSFLLQDSDNAFKLIEISSRSSSTRWTSRASASLFGWHTNHIQAREEHQPGTSAG